MEQILIKNELRIQLEISPKESTMGAEQSMWYGDLSMATPFMEQLHEINIYQQLCDHTARERMEIGLSSEEQQPTPWN